MPTSIYSTQSRPADSWMNRDLWIHSLGRRSMVFVQGQECLGDKRAGSKLDPIGCQSGTIFKGPCSQESGPSPGKDRKVRHEALTDFSTSTQGSFGRESVLWYFGSSGPSPTCCREFRASVLKMAKRGRLRQVSYKQPTPHISGLESFLLGLYPNS